jgi:DNA-binding NtrC family response regulator
LISKSRELRPADRRAVTNHPGGIRPRALLVFEDAAVASEMHAFLERAGWHVQAVASRAQAVIALRGAGIQVVLGVFGHEYEGAQLMRDVAAIDPQAKVVLAAAAEIADDVAAMNPGAYICMAKPLTPRALLSVLNGALHDGAAAVDLGAARRRIERKIHGVVSARAVKTTLASRLAAWLQGGDALRMYGQFEHLGVKPITLE